MNKCYQCPCGFKYYEEKGYPEKNIPAGTKYESLPDDFSCPVCGLNHKDWKEIS